MITNFEVDCDYFLIYFFFFSLRSLENLVKSLQAKGTSSLITENGNNVVTITTAHSSTRMNNNEIGGQTHHDTIVKPQRASQIKMISAPTSVKANTTNGGSNGNGGGTSSTTLSGPVTDL